MFTNLRRNAHLKTKSDANQIEVGFYGRVARIARVHQFGLTDRVSNKGPQIKYEERQLPGLNNSNKATITDVLRRHLNKADHP